MFFKKIDLITPPTSLYYKGENSHQSIFAGILTIIAYGLTIALAFYYLLKFINRENPTAFFFNRFVEDAGVFPVNSSMMFAFIQIYNQANEEQKMDKDIIFFFGLNSTIEVFRENPNLEEYFHWTYDYCNNDTDTEGIGELITYENFTSFQCIRYFYNKDTKKYYKTGEPGFEWPLILHGQSRRDATHYGVIMQKCRNNTLKDLRDGTKCKSEEDINKRMNGLFINYQVLDQYTDVLNYDKPIIKYFYAVTNGFYEGAYTINHLNFNPLQVNTHNGIFFDNLVKDFSYVFEQNEKVTLEDTQNLGIYICFYYWMQNRLNLYERNYERLQDVLSDIGGINSIVIVVANIINTIVQKYVTFSDAQDLVIDSEATKPQLSASSYLLPRQHVTEQDNQNQNQNGNDRNQNMMFPPKKDYRQKNYLDLMKENNIEIMKNSNDQDRSNQYKVVFSKRKEILNNYSNSGRELSSKDFILRNRRNFPGETQSKKIETEPLVQKEEVSFWNYLSYLFSCCKNNQHTSSIESFMYNVISEENLVHCYLDLYNLKKMYQNKTEGTKTFSQEDMITYKKFV